MYEWHVYNLSFALVLKITKNERRGRFISLRCLNYMNSFAFHRIKCLIFVNFLASLKILTRFLELKNKIKLLCTMFYTIFYEILYFFCEIMSDFSVTHMYTYL